MNRYLRKYRNRPFGVYVIIALLIVEVITFGADVIRVWRGEIPHTLPNLPGDLDAILFLGIAAFFILLSIGLWRLHTWAWFAAMVACGATLFYSIWRHLEGGSPYLTMTLIIVIVFYLNLNEVKAAFHAKPTEERL